VDPAPGTSSHWAERRGGHYSDSPGDLEFFGDALVSLNRILIVSAKGQHERMLGALVKQFFGNTEEQAVLLLHMTNQVPAESLARLHKVLDGLTIVRVEGRHGGLESTEQVSFEQVLTTKKLQGASFVDSCLDESREQVLLFAFVVIVISIRRGEIHYLEERHLRNPITQPES
jgi:hypothetical protein